MKQISYSIGLMLALLTVAFTPGDSGKEVLRKWKAGQVVSQKAVDDFGIDRCFKAEPISNQVFARMKGKSFPATCTVSRDDLRYIRALHYDADRNIRVGEMVANKAIAADLVSIFRQLYEARYPIERMVLIDDYNADDEQSMRDNNSSSFCFRAIAGTTKLSHHARGMAVDINTLYNPYFKRRADGTLFVQPATATPYLDRSKKHPYTISRGDLLHRLFTEHGFEWGGDWTSCKDYQHFEK